MPVFAHLEGVCHVYVDKAASLDMAKTIVLNAKMRRTGVCGAAETLLVDRAAAATHLKPLIEMLLDAGCEIRGDATVQAVDARVKPATRGRLVDRISRHHHHRRGGRRRRRRDRAHRTLRLASHRRHRHRRPGGGGEIPRARSIRPSCCTTPRRSSPTAANSASAPRSASPPARLHARGPVGVEQLTTFKYRIRGSGQTRP